MKFCLWHLREVKKIKTIIVEFRRNTVDTSANFEKYLKRIWAKIKNIWKKFRGNLIENARYIFGKFVWNLKELSQ